MDNAELKNSLESQPDSKSIKINKFANNSQYLPISHVEGYLDKIFGGENWHTKNFKFQYSDGVTIASLELHVLSPVSNQWIIRVGAGGGGITTPKGAEPAFPKIKAECLKNACKSLGKIFGRDLSRKSEDVFLPGELELESKSEAPKPPTTEVKLSNAYTKLDQVLEDLNLFKTIEELDGCYARAQNELTLSKNQKGFLYWQHKNAIDALSTGV